MKRHLTTLAAYAIAAPLVYLSLRAYMDLIIAVGRLIGTA